MDLWLLLVGDENDIALCDRCGGFFRDFCFGLFLLFDDRRSSSMDSFVFSMGNDAVRRNDGVGLVLTFGVVVFDDVSVLIGVVDDETCC